MKTWDTAIIGAGIIGLSLAIELRKQGLSVIVVDRSEPGREASSAAGGMIAHADPHNPEELIPAALASNRLYPEFIHELEEESDTNIDLRAQGTISFHKGECRFPCEGPRTLSAQDLARIAPNVSPREDAWLLPEFSLDVRALTQALTKACRHRDVHLALGAAVTDVIVEGNRAAGVRTEKAQHMAGTVVNCAGAWAGEVGPIPFPVKPIKGHMLSLVSERAITTTEPNASGKLLVQYVVRNPGVVYVVPRSDGRHIVGSTLEDVGYDKRVSPEIIQQLHQAASNLIPELGEARMLEAWTGLRPAAPDKLPLIGATSLPGYFAATGHYRDGIMLAPITAKLMSAIIRGDDTEIDVSAFDPTRFEQ